MKKYFLQKIRRLIGTDKILELQHQINNELKNQNNKLNEIYYAQLFQSTIASSTWLKDKCFSPGRWAVDFSLLYTLYRVLNEMKPQKIVEYGLGQTTRMISQYCEAFRVKAYTYEHDLDWILFFQNTFKVSDKTKICKAKIEQVSYKSFKTLRYKEEVIEETRGSIELIVLDGPFGVYRYSRIHILDLIPESINTQNFCILIDDYQRVGEKDTVSEILYVLETSKIDYIKQVYAGEKEHLLICSANNKFLTSL